MSENNPEQHAKLSLETVILAFTKWRSVKNEHGSSNKPIPSELWDKQAWPNLNAGLGLRHFSQTDDNALVASLSMNLPIFNYNQGTVKSSRSNYAKSIFDLKKIALDLNSKLRAFYLDAVQNQEEAQIVTRHLLPTAKSAVNLARKGYVAGRYSYLQLANAMRMLFSEEKHFIDAHAKLDKSVINIKGLTLKTYRKHYDK